jgi:hypothetical protein
MSTTQDIARQTHFDEMARLPFVEDRPTEETAQALRDELLFQRGRCRSSIRLA